MKLPILLAWLAAGPFAVALVAEAEEPDNIYFHESYNAALREAEQTKKPLFLEFRCAP